MRGFSPIEIKTSFPCDWICEQFCFCYIVIKIQSSHRKPAIRFRGAVWATSEPGLISWSPNQFGNISSALNLAKEFSSRSFWVSHLVPFSLRLIIPWMFKQWSKFRQRSLTWNGKACKHVSIKPSKKEKQLLLEKVDLFTAYKLFPTHCFSCSRPSLFFPCLVLIQRVFVYILSPNRRQHTASANNPCYCAVHMSRNLRDDRSILQEAICSSVSASNPLLCDPQTADCHI